MSIVRPVQHLTLRMDKKKQLLQTALELFVEFGFHNTPTSRIAKEAGIANGTLFYFYPTKDDLVIALYLDIKRRVAEYIADCIKDKVSVKDVLKGYYSATLHWALDNKMEFRFIEQFNTSPYLKHITSEEIDRHIAPILDVLKQGIQDNVIKPIDVDIILILISGHTFGINTYLVAKQASAEEQELIINDTFELLWDMIS